MSLEEKLTAAMQKALNEGLESSQDMIQSNAAQSFDDMGMASTNPGEFSPEEITNKENLVNAACMSNDTDFEGKATNQPNNSDDNSLLGAVNNIMNDLVDISTDSHCDDENCKENELHILEFGESSVSKIIDKVFSIYEPLGYDIIFTSALENDNIEVKLNDRGKTILKTKFYLFVKL